MKIRENKNWYIGRRGELLAQEFLLELDANYVASLEADAGLDYMAFFSKDDGVPIIVAIEVKATEREINGRFNMSSSLLRKLTFSNVPILLLVVDVKRNEIYFNWINDVVSPEEKEFLGQSTTFPIELRKSTPEEKEKLKHEIFNRSLVYS